MHTDELLCQMREKWLTKVSHRLARGEGVRESFLQQIDRFFDSVRRSVESGDPAWLFPLLDEWVQARTASDLEKRDTSIYPLLYQILVATYEVAQETLGAGQALEVLGALLPIYGHAFEYAIAQEVELHIAHVSRELEDARAALEQLDKSKSDFISVAAHELKTPLTLIEGYAAMLREILPDESVRPQPLLMLKGMDNGTRRLREIVDDMIDVSLIDNNMLSLVYQPIWLNRLLSMIHNDLSDTISLRNQTLTIEPFSGHDEMTYGDPERLYQALRNVISNAVKYTPDGGRIWINGRKLPGFVELTVRDTGIGIDQQDHIRIFGKFGRLGDASLHSSGKTKFKGGGPGLGLPITKGIIEAHGGSMWVESEGHDEVRCPGSTFHILLPMRKEPPDISKGKLPQSLMETYAFENS